MIVVSPKPFDLFGKDGRLTRLTDFSKRRFLCYAEAKQAERFLCVAFLYRTQTDLRPLCPYVLIVVLPGRCGASGTAIIQRPSIQTYALLWSLSFSFSWLKWCDVMMATTVVSQSRLRAAWCILQQRPWTTWDSYILFKTCYWCCNEEERVVDFCASRSFTEPKQTSDVCVLMSLL